MSGCASGERLVALRRGFKTEANEIARERRMELGLSLTSRLDPWQLAHRVDIPVLALSELNGDAPGAVRRFQHVDAAEFSAVTVFDGSRRILVCDDAHSLGRQASDVGHELAHRLPLHEPSPALDHDKSRLWDPEAEEEADWLAGAILVSDETAVSIATRRVPSDIVAEHYGVSEPMMQFRLNVTGAHKRAARRPAGLRSRESR